MVNYPLISVIIPSFNQGQFIEQTITSVIGQNYPNIELIVVDGGSTDNTLDVIEKYKDALSYFVSEPDNGQTHAINKGFRRAKGEILTWLNSDDMYLPCALSKAVGCIGSTSEPKLLYGGCLRFLEDSNYTYGRLPERFDPERLTYCNYIDQPSVFWTRSLWERVGELDESYHYVMDWDWWLRASQKCQFMTLREHLSIFRLHDVHKSSAGGLKRRAEMVRLVATYAQEEWKAVFKDVYGKEDALRKNRELFSMIGLYSFRYIFYPLLWMKHRRFRLDTALSM